VVNIANFDGNVCFRLLLLRFVRATVIFLSYISARCSVNGLFTAK